MEWREQLVVPPVHCITRAVQHLLVCGAVGTLVIPYWPSSVFWPFLFTNAIQFQPYVLEYIHFPDPSGIFALGCYKDSLIGSDRFNSAVLAVRNGAKGPSFFQAEWLYVGPRVFNSARWFICPRFA